MVQGHSQIRNDPLSAMRVLIMWKLKGSESSWEKRVGQRGFCNLPICLALTGSLSNMGDDKRSWGVWKRWECLPTSFMYFSFCLHSVVGISWLLSPGKTKFSLPAPKGREQQELQSLSLEYDTRWGLNHRPSNFVLFHTRFNHKTASNPDLRKQKGIHSTLSPYLSHGLTWRLECGWWQCSISCSNSLVWSEGRVGADKDHA